MQVILHPVTTNVTLFVFSVFANLKQYALCSLFCNSDSLIQRPRYWVHQGSEL